MEIIDELEKDKRGPYAGCIGYFGADGEMDTCIVLRTAVVKDGRMTVQAGAGIVLRFRPGVRAAGMRQQGQGPVPGRRGRGALREPGPVRPVSRAALDPRRRPRQTSRRAMTRVLVIDNYDSFTWNLVHLIGPLVERGRGRAQRRDDASTP